MSKINRKKRARQIELRHRRRDRVAKMVAKFEASKDEKSREKIAETVKRMNEHLVLTKTN